MSSSTTAAALPVIEFDLRRTPTSIILRQITEVLLEECCFPNGDGLTWAENCYKTHHQINKPAQLVGLLNQFVDFRVTDRDGTTTFQPLPERIASAWLNSPRELARMREVRYREWYQQTYGKQPATAN